MPSDGASPLRAPPRALRRLSTYVDQLRRTIESSGRVTVADVDALPEQARAELIGSLPGLPRRTLKPRAAVTPRRVAALSRACPTHTPPTPPSACTGTRSPSSTTSRTAGSEPSATGTRSLALTRVGDRYGALDNHCPHQGGPLGEGSIEKGCSGARGTGTTTTRSPARRRRASATLRRASRSKCATTASTSGSRTNPTRPAPSRTSWSRRWSAGASRTCSAWSATPTSASPTRCAAARKRAS